MELEITTKDLEEIESRYSDLGAWLMGTFTSGAAPLFILQSVMDAVDRARAAMSGEEG